MAGTNFSQTFATENVALKQTAYLENRLLEMIKLEREQFVFNALGKPYQIPANEGTTIVRMRRYLALPQFVAGHALQEGVIPTQPLKTEGVTVTATVSQFGAFMQLTDVSDMVNLDNIKQIYQPELARHAAELIEREVIGKLEAEASLFFAGNLATAGLFGGTLPAEGTTTATRIGYLKMQDLRRVALFMKNQLRSGHTKFGGKPIVVVHPNVMADLLDDFDLKNRLLDPGQENAPIKIGTLQNYQFYGIYVQESLIAPVHDLKDIPGFETRDTNPTAVTNYAFFNSVDSKYYRYNGSAFAEYTPGKVYVSFMLGKDPYIVTSLAGGSVKFMSTGFEATKDDPLGQIATVGYKLWTGAKVIDPLAITAIYSFSAFDTASILVDQFRNTAKTKDATEVVYDADSITASNQQNDFNDAADQAVSYKEFDGTVVTK